MEEYSRITRFNQGEMIFNKGDKGDCMYEVIDGSVGIYLNYGKPDEVLLAVRGCKEFFGEIALIETVPRTAAAVALNETTLRIVGVKGIVPYFKENPEAMEKVLSSMSNRIKQEQMLYFETCGIVSKFKKTVDSGRTPDAELSKQIENCLVEFDKYQSNLGTGV